MTDQNGKIIIIVAPSGTGKTSLLAQIKIDIPELTWSVSCTTRPKRKGEYEGQDYFYITEEKFKKMIKEDAFVEWALVHSNYYGTSKAFIDQGLKEGKLLLFDLDVQGCDSMKKLYGDKAKVIFIGPPGLDELEKRLRGRGTEPEEIIQERLNNAKQEIQRADDYDFHVVNQDFNQALTELKSIIKTLLVS